MSKAHIPPAVAIRGHTYLIGKKEKWTNKGTDKQYVADFYTQYNLSYLMFVPNFIILGQVAPEKSMTKNSISITLEWEVEKKDNIEKEGKKNLSTLVLFTLIHLVALIVYTKFEDCSTHRY